MIVIGTNWSQGQQTEITFEDQTEIPFADEDVASKTLIGTYLKRDMRDDSLQEAMARLYAMENVKVEHLPNVGGFVLTFQNEAHRMDRMDEINDLGIHWSEDRMVVLPDERSEEIRFGIQPPLNATSRSTAIPPNDGYFQYLWAYQKLSNNADMNMQEGWQKYLDNGGSSNGPEVIVAVCDTGVDYNHEDLKNVMWKNPGEVANNGIDDDGNGYIDDVYGVDISGQNAAGDPMDGESHGTHVAGTIGAEGNNGKGLVGVAAYTSGKVTTYRSHFSRKDN